VRQTNNINGLSPASAARDISARIGAVRQLRDCLKKVAGLEFVQADPQAQRILWTMARSSDMNAVSEHMDRFVIRVGELLSAKMGDPALLTRLVASVQQNDPKSRLRPGKQQASGPEEEESPHRRVFVRI
jgi:hypothetical protein